MSQDPIGLYIHIPFCPYRCPYCDFAIVVDAHISSPLKRPYLNLLKRELNGWADKLCSPPLSSIFFGGGTPSLLTPLELEELMHAIRSGFSLTEGLEITLEANPETVSLQQLQGFRSLGINRLSIGAQTFHPGGLQVLGRGHGAEQITEAVSLARRAGFTNISLDLIYGWQDQTLQDWENDLRQALDLKPEHLSLYALTVEPKTILARQVARGRFRTPPDDLSAECFITARAGWNAPHAKNHTIRI